MSINAEDFSSRSLSPENATGASLDARALDKFYTKTDIVHQCVQFLEACANLTLSNIDQDIIEPSAGAGAFLDILPESTLAYDLAPEDSRVLEQDFFLLSRDEPALVIGNPPFGRAARLAVKFFNHAAKFATHIGFIVPRTFEKASIQNRLDRRFHLLGQLPLPPESFTFQGEDYPVPCVFQVWIRRPEDRPLFTLPRAHPDFDFVSRECADFAFQRVGARAGAVKTDFSTVASTSHHFIRANINIETLLHRMHIIDFSEVKSRTAGNPSISKTEIVSLYSEVENAC